VRVCWVTTCFPRFEGDHSANFLLTLARGLVERGIELTVVAPHHPGSARQERFSGIEVQRFVYAFPVSAECLAYGNGIPSNFRDSHFAKLQAPGFGMSGLIAAFRAAKKAHVIHAFWTPSTLMAAPSKFLRGTPIVVTLLGSDIRSAPRHINLAALKMADAVVCATAEMGHYLSTYRFSKPVFDIKQSNLVDLKRLSASSPLEPKLFTWCKEAALLVTFVGRLIDFKDPVGFVQAIPHVLERHPEARFLIVGDGPLYDRLQGLITEMGINKSVLLTGHRNDVGSFLKLSGIFVANSPVSNCYSCAILEAMTLGVACVVSDVGDPDGSFRKKEYVRLCRPGDPIDLARAVNELLDDHQLKDRSSDMGRQFLIDYGFSADVVLKQTIDVYHSLRKTKLSQNTVPLVI
jgi:glycosyltransferase involved in cell wall biosynthesis